MKAVALSLNRGLARTLHAVRGLLLALAALLLVAAGPSLPTAAQAPTPAAAGAEWLTDTKYVNATRLPSVTNLEAAYDALDLGRTVGTISFRVLVDAEGRVSEYALATATGGLKPEACVAALTALRYSPAQRAGQAVYGRTVVSFVWPRPTGQEAEPALEDQPQLDVAPVPLNQADIAQRIGYPAAARAAGQSGRILLRVLVDGHGRYVNHVLKRTAGRLLLEAVEREVATLVFSPAMQYKKPSQAWVEVAFDFGPGQ